MEGLQAAFREARRGGGSGCYGDNQGEKNVRWEGDTGDELREMLAKLQLLK